MNNILTLAISSFNTQEDIRIQSYKNLEFEIEQALSNNNEKYINEAIIQAQNHGNNLIVQTIDSIVQTLISNHVSYDHISLKHTYSQLFVIPIITQDINEHINIPAINSIENVFYESLINNNLIDKNSKIIFSPILLGHNTSFKMTSSEWYNLHKQTILTKDKRNTRKIYAQDFFIKTEINYPTLNFFIGILLQEDKPELNLIPNLFNKHNEYNNTITQSIQHLFETKKTNSIILEPNTLLHGLNKGYNIQQEILVTEFIKTYQHLNINFLLIPITNNFKMAILTVDSTTNEIYNYLLITSFTGNIDILTIINYFNDTDKDLYLGNSSISEDTILNNDTFDLSFYLQSEGATQLNSEQS
jgi:hypothetical protein